MYKIAIDKTLIQEMPIEVFPGRMHIIDSMLNLNAAINVLRKADIVGFDTETRPAFHKGERHKVALIQLSTKDDCFLFRVNKIGIPDRLAEYLSDESCLKIGLSIHDDFRQISKISDLKPAGFVELQKMVGDYLISDMSLQKIYAILFQKKISKSQRLSNWEATELTHAQQTYASIDAWACINIYEYLKSGSFIAEESTFKVEIIEDEQQQ